jgi:DNA-binding PadR family transcriptional regulator
MRYEFEHGHHPFEFHGGFGSGRRARHPFGPGGPPGRGRGDLKYEILEALTESPRHGYDIMLEIEQKRGMRPSPGSIYPALQMLEDGDFVKGSERDGKRIYEMTNKGRELLSQREPPEDRGEGGEAFFAAIGEAMRQIHGVKDAIKQIARSGNIETCKKAVAILDRARRELYELLAEHY